MLLPEWLCVGMTFYTFNLNQLQYTPLYEWQKSRLVTTGNAGENRDQQEPSIISDENAK